jgi:hypothetical protein
MKKAKEKALVWPKTCDDDIIDLPSGHKTHGELIRIIVRLVVE